MRVIHGGRGSSFAPETLAGGRIGAHIKNHLDGDPAVETLIVGSIDDPIPPCPSLRVMR